MKKYDRVPTSEDMFYISYFCKNPSKVAINVLLFPYHFDLMIYN